MKKIQTEEIQVSERKNVMKLYEDCILCPRNCHVNRAEGKTGFCGMDSEIRAARAALHMWEEPCISGKKGSGAVFFYCVTLSSTADSFFATSHLQ